MLKASLESELLDQEDKRKQILNQQQDNVRQKRKDKESLINDLVSPSVFL